ncbi:phage tail tape measure protein [Photobacterium aquimaris]|uniref:Phage tail tape measure protein n=1 Tax=Photobacterium aquimaris TaxID=512643 RepID=A0A2T3HTC6_9GAMM|nr:phage tail tape measure protein [Photobacterium aquimaris]PQJ41140.1 phage tail tape measure protein [Photobacterium aquimaris]PST97931.1 phage tail tape measure protein [Photobacterium aquimaris]
MTEKISFVLDASVKGVKDIVSTTTATERLTAALAEQRGEVQSLNGQLKGIKGFEAAELRAEKLSAQLTETKSTMTSLSAAIAESKQKTTQLRGEYNLTQNEIRGLNQEMQQASKEGAQALQVKLKEAQLRLEVLNTEIYQNKAQTNDLSVAYKRASGKLGKLTDRQEKQHNTLNKLKSSLQAAGVSTDKLGDEQNRLKQQADKATLALEKQNARLKEMQSIQGRIDSRKAKLGEIGSEATGLAAAAAPIVGSIWTAIKNESSFADVKKVVNMSDEQSSELQSWALKTSTTTPMSADNINAMLAAGGQSGIKDINELKSFVLDSSKMGVAFDMDAGQAGETLSVFKAALGVDQQGAMNVAGLANYLSNNSNAKAKDIAGVMAREGASAKTGGFKVNESTALSASLLSLGMGEERAATALKNISGRLTLGDAASGTQQKAMASIGLDADDIAARMQDDASGTLIEVLNAVNQAPKEDKSAILSQIFGEESKGAVASLSGNMANFTKLLTLSKEETSVHRESLNQEYDAKLSTTGSGIDMFVNKLNRLSVVFGSALLPALNWVLEPLGKGVDLLANFAEANTGVTQAVGIGVAAFIGLKGVLLTGKALSLVFGNSMDKTRLFTKGLNRETQDGGRIAALAAKRWRSLNAAVSSSQGPESKGNSSVGKDARSRKKRKGRRRVRGRRKGLGGLLSSVMESRVAQKVGSGAQSLMDHVFSPKGAGLALAGSALLPMTARASDVIDPQGKPLTTIKDKSTGLGSMVNTVTESRIAQKVGSGAQPVISSKVADVALTGSALLPTTSSKSTGLGQIVNTVTESRIAQKVGSGAQSLMSHITPKGIAMALAGSGLALTPMSAMASDTMDMIGIGGDIAETVGKTGLTKVLKPLGIMMNASSVAEGVINGDMEQTGGALGDIGGSMGGGALGAAIGTFILPGIGTAIGGLLGSIAGGMGGEMLGGWFGKKLDSPEETAKKVDEVQSKEAMAKQSPPISFSPTFQITAAAGQDEKLIAQEITRQMNQQLSSLMGENTLSTQFSYAAIDRDS